MLEATKPIAMIPSDCFRWQPRVQFIDSFPTREAALNCAFEHGYNLIVERREENSALFDVLDDPEGACTSGLELELLKTEEVLVDPYTEGWTSLMLSSIWDLLRHLGASVARLYVRQVAPRLRHSASRHGREELQHTFRRAWGKHGNWGLADRARQRVALVATLCRREIKPRYRSAAHRCWWSDSAIAVRRGWHRHSQGGISDVARCFAAEASVFYTRKVVPFCRSAASRSWWSDPAIALRRGLNRYSQGTVSDASKRLAAEASVIYAREVAPKLRDALRRCRQADLQGACRHAWTLTLLAVIHFTDQFAATVARLYFRDVAPRLRQAAARYQQADLEGRLRRSIVAVAPPPQSNASQLH